MEYYQGSLRQFAEELLAKGHLYCSYRSCFRLQNNWFFC